MAIISAVQISALLICCLIAAITDIKTGKISNILIGVFFLIGIVLDVILYGMIDRSQLLVFLINAGSLVIVAVISYVIGIWAGGDCKLLIIVALLFPQTYTWTMDGTNYSEWYLVGLIFATGFIYLVIESVVLQKKEGTQKHGKAVGQSVLNYILQYIKALIYLNGINALYTIFVLPYIELPVIVYSFLCLFLLWGMVSLQIYNSKILLAAVLGFDIIISFMTGKVLISTFWGTYIIVLVFMLLRGFINQYNYMTIQVSEVKTGDILSQASSMLMQNSRVKGVPDISDETMKSRISESEAESIKRWAKSKNGTQEIVIVRKMPFAVFVLIGLILYLILKGLMF